MYESVSTVAMLEIQDLHLTLTAKLFIGLYNALVILIGFIGNLSVLYCSLRHGAIEMDRTTLAFIENLALADILITVLFYLPLFVTLVSGSWIFGEQLCWFTGFFSSHIPFLAEISVIMAISCYRLWVLKKPPGQRKRIRVTHVKIFISCIWAATPVPIVYWLMSGAYAYYDKKILSCWTSNHKPEHADIYLSTKIFTVFYVAAPMIIVFLCNVKIMYTIILHTLKVGRSMMPYIRTVITVNLICWAFLVSYLPIFVLLILKSTNVAVPNWFGLFQVYAKSIHVVLNPFIYVATNTRFRNYVAYRINRHTYQQEDDEDESRRRRREDSESRAELEDPLQRELRVTGVSETEL